MFFKGFSKKSRNESVAYHLRMHQYKGMVDHFTGPPKFSGLFMTKDGAVQIPSDATWPQIRAILWSQIMNRFYGIVQESTRQNFTIGFGVYYTVPGDPETYHVTGLGQSYDAVSALLRRKDIKVFRLDVGFAPSSRANKDDGSQTSSKHLPKVQPLWSMDEKV